MFDIYQKLETLAKPDPMIREFNDYLAAIGLPNAQAEYNGMSHVDVYCHTDKERGKARRVLKRRIKEVIDAFFELAHKHQIEMDGYAAKERWNEYSFTACSIESACINAAARASKEEIIAALRKEFGTAPKYIFCHGKVSGSWSNRYGYYFYFEGQYDEYVALCKWPRSVVRALCNEIIRRNDPSGFCRNFNVCIEYLNRDEPPEYGFWRED